MNATKAQLVGRTITHYEPNPTRDRTRGVTIHDPVITLDNGVRLSFYVEESDTGEYGVGIRLIKPAKGGAE